MTPSDADRLMGELIQAQGLDEALPLARRLTKAYEVELGPVGNGRAVDAESFAAIRAEPARWLWSQRIPLGTASLLVGREKLGKSTLTAELAARLSRGELPGDLEGEPAGTLIVSYEDSAARTIKPRLLAAGGDLERVRAVRVEDGEGAGLVNLPTDAERIGELAAEHGARLVVVDPLSASLSADVDSHRDQDIRRALAPLVRLAEDRDLAVLCLAHFNKSQHGDALGRVLGSRGLTAAVRSVLAFGRPPDADDDSPDRVLAHAASNLAPEAPSLTLRHEGCEVTGAAGETIATNRLVIVGETETRADDLITVRSADERTDREAAVDWLADELADGAWHESRTVKAAASAAGVAERTLQRALKTAHVETRREGFPAVSQWRIAVAPGPVAPLDDGGAGGTDESRIASGFAPPANPQSRHVSETGATAVNGRQVATLEDALLNPDRAEQIRASVDGEWLAAVGAV